MHIHVQPRQPTRSRARSIAHLPLAWCLVNLAARTVPRPLRKPCCASCNLLQPDRALCEATMLRDDSAGGHRRESVPRNVLGERLEICSITPMTGFFRDGCCNTSREDVGS